MNLETMTTEELSQVVMYGRALLMAKRATKAKMMVDGYYRLQRHAPLPSLDRLTDAQCIAIRQLVEQAQKLARRSVRLVDRIFYYIVQECKTLYGCVSALSLTRLASGYSVFDIIDKRFPGYIKAGLLPVILTGMLP